MAKMLRIVTTDGATGAYVVWGLNHLLQSRQFAFDGRYWFYQPTTSSKFQKVNSRDLPDNVVVGMMNLTNKSREELLQDS